MFDSLRDERGIEWQTKAYDCELAVYDIGDTMPRADFPAAYPHTYQVDILGATDADPYTDSFATIRDDVLTSIHDPRDEKLPRIDYGGYLVAEGI